MSATATGAGATADTSATATTTADTTQPAAAPAAPPAPATGVQVVPPAPVVPPSEQLLAGKFKTQADLANGYSALAEKLGLKGVVRDTFEKPEDHVAAYKALEARLGAKPPAEPAKPADQTGITQPPPPAKDVDEIVSRAGLSKEEIADTFLRDGKLTDAQYDALAKQAPGVFSREVVDQIIGVQIASAQQRQQQYMAKAVTIAGGQQQLQTMLNYAAGLPESVQKDLNERLGDGSRMEGALLEIQQRFLQAARAGGSGQLIGDTMGASGATLYAGNAEMNRDMTDPRYGKDPNYTAVVRSKFQRSVKAGTVKPGSLMD